MKRIRLVTERGWLAAFEAERQLAAAKELLVVDRSQAALFHVASWAGFRDRILLDATCSLPW